MFTSLDLNYLVSAEVKNAAFALSMLVCSQLACFPRMFNFNA